MSVARVDSIARGRWYPPGVFAAALALYVATMPRGILPGDSGELAAAAHTLSVAHPPGYPLYLMVGKLFSAGFASGTVAFRLNLLSGIAGAATAALAVPVLFRLGVGRLLSVLVALALATLQSFWLQATMTEVYAFNGLFTMLLLYLAVRGAGEGDRAYLIVSFIGGLAVSHHLSLVYPLLGSLLLLAWGRRTLPRPGTLALGLVLFALGLSIWLYIPVRSSLGPPLTWDSTDTLSGFVRHISAQDYAWRLRTWDAGRRLANFAGYFGALGRGSGIALGALALIAVAAGVRKIAQLAGLVLVILLYGFHSAIYSIPDMDSHIFPAVLATGILGGLGLERIRGLRKRWPPAAYAALALAGAILTFNLFQLRPRADAHLAGDYAAAVAASAEQACGPYCLVITSGAPASYPLLYGSLAGELDIDVFDLGSSNPGLLGAAERPRTLERCVELAAGIYGTERIGLLGPAPSVLLGRPTSICGMVWVLGGRDGECPAPGDLEIRGVGAEVREYSSRLLSASRLLHSARWYAAQGDQDGVGRAIDMALAASGRDAGTCINAAQIYLEIGRTDQALTLARRAVEIDPEFFDSHGLLGSLYMIAGRADLAVPELEMAIAGNPNPAPAHSNLANAYAMNGQHPQALEHFRKALQLDSTLANAHIGMGRSLAKTGRIAEALASFERAAEADSASEGAYHGAASLLLDLGRQAEAARVIRAGLMSNRESSVLLSDMGLYFLREDQPDSAAAYLEAALDINPTLLNAIGNLAVAYERMGQTSEAVEQYRLYLEVAPAGAGSQQAERALERLAGPAGSRVD
jgi:tetratricopeptide (TPR) repeat protein